MCTVINDTCYFNFVHIVRYQQVYEEVTSAERDPQQRAARLPLPGPIRQGTGTATLWASLHFTLFHYFKLKVKVFHSTMFLTLIWSYYSSKLIYSVHTLFMGRTSIPSVDFVHLG